jgi:hypothetical protein
MQTYLDLERSHLKETLVKGKGGNDDDFVDDFCLTVDKSARRVSLFSLKCAFRLYQLCHSQAAVPF